MTVGSLDHFLHVSTILIQFNPFGTSERIELDENCLTLLTTQVGVTCSYKDPPTNEQKNGLTCEICTNPTTDIR